MRNFFHNFLLLILSGLQVQVIVNEPPNLYDPISRSDFKNLLDSFENTEYTMNHNATMLWWDAYESHLESDFKEHKISRPASQEEYYIRMRDWLLTAGGRKLWELNMDWASGNESDLIVSCYSYVKRSDFQSLQFFGFFTKTTKK